MRRFIFTVIIVLLFAAAVSAAPTRAANGILRENLGQRILHVWGTNYEMGYAQGVLLSDEVLGMMEMYSFPATEDEAAEYEWKRDFVMDTFDFEEELLQEEQGIYDGMIDAGVPTFVTILGRDFDVDDLLTLTAMRDLAGLLCTTLIGWDAATAGDPEIAGQLAVGHNTDFRYISSDPYRAGAHEVTIAYSPSDPKYQRLVSITFPGFIGVVTGMNESGIGIATNRGMFQVELDQMILDPKPDVGVWSTRKSLMLRDFDGNGSNTIDDVLSYYDDIHHFGSLLVQIFGPADRSDPPAAVLEINNISRVVRYPEDDPNLAPDMIMALNWEDKLMPQRETLHQIRYDNCVNRINDVYGNQVSINNLWDFLYVNRGQPPVSVTFFTALLLPEPLRIALSPWKDKDNVPSDSRVWYDYEDFFLTDTPDDDTTDDTAADDTTSADDTVDDAADDAADDSVSGDDDPSPSDDVDNDDDSGGCGC